MSVSGLEIERAATRGSGARVRAFSAVLCWLVGSWLGFRFEGMDAIVWWSIACGGLAFAAATRGLVMWAGFGLTVAMISAGWLAHRVHEESDNTLTRVVGVGDVGMLVEIEGVVVKEVERSPAPRGALGAYARWEPSCRFVVRADRVVGGEYERRVTGRVMVRGPEGMVGSIDVGDRVRVIGLLRDVPGAMNPGERAHDKWARQRGIVGSLRIDRMENVVVLEGVADRGFVGLITVGRSLLRDRCTAILRGDDETEGVSRGRALALAMTLGERDEGLEGLDGSFTRTGVAHLLAISGFHLGVLALLGVWAIRFTGERGWLEPALVAMLVVVYASLVPAKTPIVRAAVMVVALLASMSLGRRHDRVAVLCWVAVGVMIWRPMEAFGLGFRLSFGLTGLLLWIGPSLSRWAVGAKVAGLLGEHRGLRELIVARARLACGIAAMCWIASAPLVLSETGELGLLGPLAVLIVTPISVLVIGLGAASMIVGLVWFDAGVWLGGAAAWCGGIAAWCVEAIDGMGLTLRGGLGLVAATVGTVLLVLWMRWGLRERLRRGWWDRRSGGAVVFALLLMLGDAWWRGRLDHDVALRVDTLAVGDGTCHVIRSGDEVVLWDCGSGWADIGVRRIPDALRALGVMRIDAVVLTHPNFDHYCGLLDVADRVKIDRVYLTSIFFDAAEESIATRALLEGLAVRAIDVEVVSAGDKLELGHISIDVLCPRDDRSPATFNDGSVAALISIGERSDPTRVLLTGDLQENGLRGLRESLSVRGLPRISVMEAPHHGSFIRESEAIVLDIDPEFVVQSTGMSRLGDERWDRAKTGRAWGITARDGALWFEVNRQGVIEWGSSRGR